MKSFLTIVVCAVAFVFASTSSALAWGPLDCIDMCDLANDLRANAVADEMYMSMRKTDAVMSQYDSWYWRSQAVGAGATQQELAEGDADDTTADGYWYCGTSDAADYETNLGEGDTHVNTGNAWYLIFMWDYSYADYLAAWIGHYDSAHDAAYNGSVNFEMAKAKYDDAIVCYYDVWLSKQEDPR